MTELDELLRQLLEDHGIDVVALQAKAEAGAQSQALTNALTKALADTGVVKLQEPKTYPMYLTLRDMYILYNALVNTRYTELRSDTYAGLEDVETISNTVFELKNRLVTTYGEALLEPDYE